MKKKKGLNQCVWDERAKSVTCLHCQGHEVKHVKSQKWSVVMVEMIW